MIYNINKATSEANIASSAINAGGNIAASIIESSSPMGWIDSLIDGISNTILGAVNYITQLGTTRNNNSAATEQIYWLKAREGNDEMTKNTGFYIIIGLALVAVTTIIIINNTKKS